MPTEFQMPKLGLTMESGTILSWLVDDGAVVEQGQAVLMIETDKVESEVEASGSGRLTHVGVVGETYDCGAQIGWLLDPDEEESGAAAASAAALVADVVVVSPIGGRVLASPNAKRMAALLGVDLASVAGSGPGGRVVSEDVEVLAPAPGATSVNGRILASPNAKRMAASRGVDLRTVAGSGPGGRIVSEDVEAAAAVPAIVAAPAAPFAAALTERGSAALATFAARQLADLLGVDIASVPASGAGDPRVSKDDVARHVRSLLATGRSIGTAEFPLLQTPTQTVPLKGMRGTIASRMHQSLQEMAQLTLNMDVDMAAVMADRDVRKAKGSAPGFTDYVIAAAAKALKDHPYVNSQITPAGVCYLPDVNVGLAVSLDGGLIVPVIGNTDLLDLETLSSETTRLAEAARAGKLVLSELEGGTFSVTALGMYGVDGFTPVINPPNTAILGVGRLRDDVAWGDDGSPLRTTRLTLSLTWDHRAFDGAPAAEFAQTIKKYLENV